MDVTSYEIGIEIFCNEIFALQVYDGAFLSFFVYQHNGGDAGFASHLGIIGSEVGSDVNDACSVFGGDVVSGNHAEGTFLHR